MPSVRLGLPKKLKTIILPLIAAVCMATYVAMDKYYLSVIAPNPYAFSLVSMWIGAIATGVFVLALRIPRRRHPDRQLIGMYFDPNFRGIILPRRRTMLLLVVAGLCSAVSTITYFYIVTISSATIIIPFAQILLVYLVLAESFWYRDSPTVLELQSILMILIGIFLMATTEVSIDWVTILLVLGPYNISVMIYTMALRQAKRMAYLQRKNDSINLRFWSLLFNAIFISVLIIPFITPNFFAALAVLNTQTIIYIVIDMLISTLAFVAYIRALGIAKMSIVNAVLSFAIVLSIPITLIGNFFVPGAFGLLTSSPLFWLFKGLGIILVIIGIITIGLSQLKAYLLIYITQSTDTIMTQLTRIKGIKSVAAVSGDRMLIAQLSLHSLGKAYRTIITDIENLEGIKKVVLLASLKEWKQI
ncbi:MAG: EamA family transporter [Candidatus Helarchaeota archaeon]